MGDNFQQRLQGMKCPNCEANIFVDISGRNIAFCQYCGTQIMVNDGVTRHEYRKVFVDETEIRKSDNDSRVKMKELENEEYQIKHASDTTKSVFIFLIIFMGIGMFSLIFMGVFFSCNGSGSSESDIKKKIKYEMELQGKISAGNYYDYEGKNYKAVLNDLQELGFTNVECLDLNDADGFSFFGKKDDIVESVSIKGNKKFDENDYFNPDDKVLICYH